MLLEKNGEITPERTKRWSQSKNNKVNGNGIILINNGLNAPTKTERMAEWIQKQDSIYTAYKRPTSK